MDYLIQSTFDSFNDFKELEDCNDGDFVDFSNAENKEEASKTIVTIKEVEYDHTTKEKYRVFRLRKMDPISLMDIREEHAFKFKHKWDPYTGERKEDDLDGALYFDPDMLIKSFYTKRLDKLWIHPVDTTNGYFQGYYGDGVGAGEEFYIKARGSHPDWYLFRLPIIDCYLTPDHNKQFITLGPKLTDDEIIEIDRIANLRKDNYKKMFGVKRPSLINIKKLYDTAIAPIPYVAEMDPAIMSKDKLQEYYNRVNREAVNSLISIKG